MAGLLVDLESAWASACGRQLGVTCKRTWGSAGHRRDFVVGCPLASAAVSSCTDEQDRWNVPHLAVRALFARWSCRVTQLVQRSPLWPAFWLPAIDKSRNSKSAEVRRVWEIYDDRLQFMSRVDALALDASLKAWLVWSSAVEAALADAYQLAGGLVP